MDPFPSAILLPTPEDSVHRVPIRELFGNVSPLAARPAPVEDGVDDPSPVDRLATTLFRLRQQILDQLPLFVRQITGIFGHT